MIVVSNSTPLIGLASIGRFDLLQHFFGETHIAKAVYEEVVTAGRGRFAEHDVRDMTWVFDKS